MKKEKEDCCLEMCRESNEDYPQHRHSQIGVRENCRIATPSSLHFFFFFFLSLCISMRYREEEMKKKKKNWRLGESSSVQPSAVSTLLLQRLLLLLLVCLRTKGSLINRRGEEAYDTGGLVLVKTHKFPTHTHFSTPSVRRLVSKVTG